MNQVLNMPWHAVRFVLRKIVRRVREPSAQARVPPTPPADPVNVHQENTPNPNAIKFTASIPVVESGSIAFTAAESTENPLGVALLAIEGVSMVFAVSNFVTVTKHPHASWSALSESVRAAVEEVLTQHGTLPARRP